MRSAAFAMPEELTWLAGQIPQQADVARENQAGQGVRLRIRTSLIWLVAASMLPGILLSAWFIVSDYRQHKAHAIQNAIAIARAGTASLDRDLAGISAALRVLASSSALSNDDLTSFYTQAQNALPYQAVSNYVLIDASGRQLLNTLKPWGSPLPIVGGPPQLQRIFDTGEPMLTDVFVGPVTGKPILALGVPVMRDKRIVYSLNAGIFPERIAKVLLSQNLPRNWISAVLDSKGNVVARTHDMARFVGKPAVPDLVRMSRQSSEGVLETVTLEGIPVVTAFSRSRLSDWCVAVGIPQAQLTAELKRSLFTLLVASVLLYLSALWVAWRLAVTRVMQPAHELLKRMQAIAHGQEPGPVDMQHTPHEFIMLEHGFADMSAKLREREKEREAKLAAEAANRAKTAFLSRMSHELRTPLNAVLGFTQVLQLDHAEPLTERQRNLIGLIDSSGQHLLSMISDILDFSRIESGQLRIEFEQVDAGSLIEACHQMMQADAAQARLQLAIINESQNGQVRADLTRLKQVLLNLLSNAIKYNRPGGHVTLSLQRQGDCLRFAVRDTGLGMSAQQCEHLFEPFNRLGRHHSDKPGTGIGLVICKQLLALMGSDLHVRSAPDQGSEFWFDLPQAP
ncbi:MAG TPA: ATP-binding protein [Aquabacterium sp.]|uniref:sensor histidine kinase n=1 Tax=Aquabacterium sp. TaxID=1872578 RepID=UPI002E35B463|nr:ATP-binding protein [Aquabacterium sp.]HEX5356074.1 ATP-binding protein [Aquabacterium sp.]